MNNLLQNFIECDGIKVAASVFTHEIEEHPIYFIANYMLYIECGTLNISLKDRVYTINAGEFALVRKHSQGTFSKILDKEKHCFKECAFAFHDTFLKEVIQDFQVPRRDPMPFAAESLVVLPSHPILKGFVNSLQEYFASEVELDQELIKLKTREALYGLTKVQADLIHMFDDFAAPNKVSLADFMELNFTYNLTLKEFAQLSGRSLTSFNREFRKIFSITPHKWIKQKRLELANQLLRQTNRMASDIYLEVGFEDLSHFSRSFKSYFGYNPSTVKTKQS
ncbi:MAG: AraC family transcriptional regulator [Bacteroidota bacterium]